MTKPMREFSSGAEMRAHYKRVHARFYPPVTRCIAAETGPEIVARPEPELIPAPPPIAPVVAELSISWIDARNAVGAMKQADIPIHAVVRIQRVVAKYFGITVLDLLSERRLKIITYPRQIGMYLCRVHTLKSTTEIGRKFGKKDHSTVVCAVNKIKRLLKENTQLQHQITELEALIAGKS